jgi:transposase
METADSYSDSYITVEQMIRRRELSLSELEHLLDALRMQQNITTAEQQALLELAWGINIDSKSSA